jgi:hypothetical protein
MRAAEQRDKQAKIFKKGFPMSNINESNLVECVSIRGVIINLSDVSHELRRRFHSASRGVGRGDKARDELNAVGEAILAEQMPNLATKAFNEAHKRSRVPGHSAMERLMLGRSK